ncbi:MAG: phospholipid carrier-dependent glycosyltransferase [Clostridia bacterium]|nr:phospholipid carrier-dependent glycosyltransferase [Clostridia bacterium]
MRKFISVISAVLLLFMLFEGALSENLIENASFSSFQKDGSPSSWYQDSWDATLSEYKIITHENGKQSAYIYNFSENDARWVQEVPVEANSFYKITCLVMAEDIKGSGRGATISIITNKSIHSDSLFDTNGEWKELVLYGKTGNKQKNILVAGRIGGYGAVATGKAWFTNFSVEKLDSPPDGIIPVSFEDSRTVSYSSSYDNDTQAPKRNTQTLLLLAFICLLLFFMAFTSIRRSLSAKTDLLKKDAPSSCAIITTAAFFFIAFLLRVYFAVAYRGYYVDVTNFLAWGESFLTSGASFYTLAGLHDYPPMYMFVLALESLLRHITGVSYNSPAHILMIKLAPIFADLIFALIIYRIFSKKASHTISLILSAFILFNPAYITDSAAWGQVDSVLALLIALTVLYAAKGKWKIALPVYAAAVLTKPQALLFGPVGLAALAMDAYSHKKDKKYLKNILISVFMVLGVLYVVSAPFAFYEEIHVNGGLSVFSVFAPIRWMIELYTSTASGYEYITVNALNLYTLLDMNWRPMDACGWLTTLSWILFALSYVCAIALQIFSKSRKSLFLTGAVVISLIFAFAPMMHERYLFPVLALVLLAYSEYGDKRLLYVFFSFTITQFLNQALVLQCGMAQDYTHLGHLDNSEVMTNSVFSAVNILTTLYLSYISVDILILKHTSPLLPFKNTSAPILEKPSDHRLHMRRIDYILILAVTFVYSFLAFFNLGTLKAPETYWKNTDYQETVVLDLGEVRTFRMTYYGGISSAPFTVALSNDGENWTEENYAVYSEGDIFRWIWYAPKSKQNGSFINASYNTDTHIDTGVGGACVAYPSYQEQYPLQTARFVRLTAEGIGLPLHEVGFWNVETETLYPVVSVKGSVPENHPEYLIDEQDTVAFTPSYFNGTYFDEIYHARTAYEFINEMSVLEWSHPHLGKILIMLGIEIFGMNPFGWRFMGALFGVLMLPAMYLLIKQLTKSTKLSFFGMFFMAVDSMHFTQSRIATVDSYAVFFIMMMYLFMFRYYQMNMHRERLIDTFKPLGLSGLFMGFACASKWIGMYAGVGLAVIFFTSVTQRYLEFRKAKNEIRGKKGGKAGIEDEYILGFPMRIILTFAFCILVFIIIPALIYFLSYYWHFAPLGKFNFDHVWDMQKQMFNYHAGLSGDTHTFRSPWYEWPLVGRPMWYYSSDVHFLGYGIVSSISCMGNPIVWWTGAAMLIVMLVMLAFGRKFNHNYFLIAIGFASQFLPWVLVPRSTFIYHYFASVPFIILASALVFERFEKIDKYAARITGVILMSAALVVFIMFYPLESGYPCDYDYALMLRWFDWYNFALQ